MMFISYWEQLILDYLTQRKVDRKWWLCLEPAILIEAPQSIPDMDASSVGM